MITKCFFSVTQRKGKTIELGRASNNLSTSKAICVQRPSVNKMTSGHSMYPSQLSLMD